MKGIKKRLKHPNKFDRESINSLFSGGRNIWACLGLEYRRCIHILDFVHIEKKETLIPIIANHGFESASFKELENR